MTEPLIWTRDDILRFTHEPDFYDRSWAWGWLISHHRAEASHQAARAILDPDPSVACTGIAIFASAPTPEAREAIEALSRRTDLEPSVRQELDALDNPVPRRKVEDPIADAIARLSPRHDELRREAPGMLKSRELDPMLVALGALGNQQHQWATDIVVDALPALVTRGDPSMVWDTLGQLCDRRSLPALAAVWEPGEQYVATLYARIHRLSGSGDAVPRGIARDVEEEAARVEAILARRNQSMAGAAPRTRRLEIRCTACGRSGECELALEKLAAVAHYAGAEKAGREGPKGTVFECKHCGVKNAYELGGFAWISLAGAMEELKGRR
jgi:hypothetical protein